jgi:hypothetical protein
LKKKKTQYAEIEPNAANSVAFAQIGMNWAKYLVLLKE